MYRFVIVILLSVCLGGYACKKEAELSGNRDNISKIDVMCDDEDISKTYAPDHTNEFSQYSFGGVAGNYFGYTSTFEISDKVSIEIIFGTALSKNTSLSDSDMLKLIGPGKKTFGSLGAFTSYPELQPNRVEIAYTDKHDTRWCSTQITEKLTQYGIQAHVKVEQPHGEFEVDKVQPVEIPSVTDGYRIDGHFNCILYEVNGKKQKKMEGSFSGVVSKNED